MYSASSDSYLFTANYTEVQYAYTNQKYDTQISPGYGSPSPTKCSRCTLKPVYRVDKAKPVVDELLTTSDQEATDAVSKSGYTRNGIAFYCADKLNDCGATLTYYRYIRSNKQHFYTSDLNEGTKLVNSGNATYEGILCYIWLQ